MRIEVLQHIYSNVPKDSSPSGRRGYQTLFYTHSGLSEEEIILLEERSQYYSPSTISIDQLPVKYQFYPLDDYRGVVSQIIPLQELDEFGRRGRYIAHNLVIPRADLEQLEYCPLELLNKDLFCADLDTAFKLGDFHSGNIPPKVINVGGIWEDRALQFAQDWSKKELLELAHFGWQAELLMKNRESLGISGKIGHIFQLLSIVFLLTPPEKRVFLTFDTYTYGCNWTRNWPFWVWGSDKLNDLQTTYKIDADNKHVLSTVVHQETNSFEKWVENNVIPTNLECYIAERDQALLLDRALREYQLLPTELAEVDDRFAQSYCNLNKITINDYVMKALPKGLSKSILNIISQDVTENPWGYLKLLQSNTSSGWIPNLFEAILLENPKINLPKNDQKIMSEIAKDTGSIVLDGLLKLINADMAGWKKELEGCSGETYRKIVTPLIQKGVITAGGAFSPAHIATWCKEYVRYYQPGEISSILTDLDRYQKTVYVDQLECVLLYMNNADKETLRRWLKKYSGYAPNLQAYFRSTSAASEGIGEKIKKSLFGKKDASATSKKHHR